MSFSVTGTIKKIGDTIQVGEKGTNKREFVVSVMDNNFSNDMAFQLMKDKVSLVDKCHVGDNITVHFSIKSNESGGKYYTNLTAWKIS